jgi:hypothetical protein
MKKYVMEKLQALSKEDMAVTVFGATFFIGVWYAIPMVNTITDVWGFGGGVLRAMEAHTILPAVGDAPYGTISFFQNYLAMIVALGFGFVYMGFDVEALKTFLILNPSFSLIPSRIVSALTAVALLVVVYRFLKVHVVSSWWRFTLLILVFGNVLTSLLTRSGKMWMLSIAFGIVSFIYLYRSLVEERQIGVPGRLALISIVTAFLATANFPFAGIFLINIAIIFWLFPKTVESVKKLTTMVLGSGALFLGIVALNFQNTLTLVKEFAVGALQPATKATIDSKPALSFVEAFWVNLRQAVEAFPLLLVVLLFVAVVVAKLHVRDKVLAYLAVSYSVVWMVMASVLFRADHGLALNVRHIFPLCFFLLFLIVAFREPSRRVAAVFGLVGIAVYAYMLVLLSVPTTYNDAYDFVMSEYGDKYIRIDERIFELSLPMNKSSYELYSEASCGSACKHGKVLNAETTFAPVVVTELTDTNKLATLPPADLAIIERSIPSCTPVARFGNNVPDNEVFDIDINLGRMLMPSFYKLHQLGKNVYIYDTAECPVSSMSAR